jgi:uncharacterized protein YydD (DUF2326 family)
VSTLNLKIQDLENQLDRSKIVDWYKKTNKGMLEEIEEMEEWIVKQILSKSIEHDLIKKQFEEFYRKTFNWSSKAILVIDINESWNIEFESTVINTEETKKVTWMWDWYTSTKVICASLILAILISYSNKSFFRFAYHDWVLETWWDSLKNNFLKYLKEMTSENDIQYIISMIKSDIPKWDIFDTNDIVVNLNKDNLLFWINY